MIDIVPAYFKENPDEISTIRVQTIFMPTWIPLVVQKPNKRWLSGLLTLSDDGKAMTDAHTPNEDAIACEGEFAEESTRAREIGAKSLSNRLYRIPVNSEQDAETIILAARMLLDHNICTGAQGDQEPSAEAWLGHLFSDPSWDESFKQDVYRAATSFVAEAVTAQRAKPVASDLELVDAFLPDLIKVSGDQIINGDLYDVRNAIAAALAKARREGEIAMQERCAAECDRRAFEAEEKIDASENPDGWARHSVVCEGRAVAIRNLP